MLKPHLPGHLQKAPLEIEATPFYPQTQHQCGPAALATTLGSSGVEVTPQALAPQVYLPARQGSLQTELVAAVRRHGRLAYIIEPGIGSLLEELQAGRPVLVLQNLGTHSYPFWHYAVVIGYRPDRDQIILRSGTTRREITPAQRFLRSWQLADFWGLVVLRPGELPAVAQPDRYLKAVADLESTGQTAAAGLAYAEATRRWPNNATAWLGLGNTEFKSGRFEQAEQNYRQSIRAAPDSLAAYNNLAEAQAKRGCFDAALMTIGSALELPGEPAQRLRGLLLQTRREIVEKRPPNYIGDPATCRDKPPFRTGPASGRLEQGDRPMGGRTLARLSFLPVAPIEGSAMGAGTLEPHRSESAMPRLELPDGARPTHHGSGLFDVCTGAEGAAAYRASGDFADGATLVKAPGPSDMDDYTTDEGVRWASAQMEFFECRCETLIC